MRRTGSTITPLCDPVLAELLGWSLKFPVTASLSSATCTTTESTTKVLSDMPIVMDESLVHNAIAHRVTGALLATDGQISHIPEDLKPRLVDAHDGAMMWCLLLEQRLLEIKGWFDAEGGIDFRIIKGASVAHLDEIDSSFRSFADIDILIAESDMDKAIKILTSNGAVRRIAQRRPGFDRRYAKGVGTVFGDGIELDIHRNITGREHGFRIPTADLFSDPEPFVIGGETFLAISRPHRAMHAAYHAVASSSSAALHTIRDLGGYLNDPVLDPDVLGAIAQRWGGLEVLGKAVQQTLATFELDSPTWGKWLANTEFNRDAMARLAQVQSDHHFAIEWETIRELKWLDRFRFGWAVFVPSREHTDSLKAAGELEGNYWLRRLKKLRRAVIRKH